MIPDGAAIVIIIVIMAFLSYLCYYTAWVLLDAFLERFDENSKEKVEKRQV